MTSGTDIIASWSASDRKTFWREIDDLRIRQGASASLNKRPTEYQGHVVKKEQAAELLTWGVARLAELQDRLYADNRHSLLIVLQAMDTAGKDGAIKHIMSGLNPQGVKVTSFKRPSAEELDHDFLWRHYKALPPRGEIGIFNRSHYENVLISRVHPELVLAENLPGVDRVSQVNKAFWNERYHIIRQFENITAGSGTVVLKFFLHMSKDEQRRRLIKRIDDTEKNWKFSIPDIEERQHWVKYHRAYEDAITATSTDHAPWFVIPADNKWYARIAMAAVIFRHLDQLGLRYPTVTPEERKALLKVRKQLDKGNP